MMNPAERIKVVMIMAFPVDKKVCINALYDREPVSFQG